MSRHERIKAKVIKAELKKHLTEEDLREILQKYIQGTRQALQGETIAAVIEAFFADGRTIMRERFNYMADELLEMDRKKPQRFRQKVLMNLIIAYQNGTVEGAYLKKHWDLAELVKAKQEELGQSAKYKLR